MSSFCSYCPNSSLVSRDFLLANVLSERADGLEAQLPGIADNKKGQVLHSPHICSYHNNDVLFDFFCVHSIVLVCDCLSGRNLRNAASSKNISWCVRCSGTLLVRHLSSFSMCRHRHLCFRQLHSRTQYRAIPEIV